MREHFWRQKTYAPYFDARTSWYPNAWTYKDLYAIYVDGRGEVKPDQHDDWILKDAQGKRLYIPYNCHDGSCSQYAGDIGNPAFRAQWIDGRAGHAASRLQGPVRRRRQHGVPRQRRPGPGGRADRPAHRQGHDLRRLAPLHGRVRRGDHRRRARAGPGDRDRAQPDLVLRAHRPVRAPRPAGRRHDQPRARHQRRQAARLGPLRLLDLHAAHRLAARARQGRRARLLHRHPGGGRVQPRRLLPDRDGARRRAHRLPPRARRLVERLRRRPRRSQGPALHDARGSRAAGLHGRLRARQPAGPANPHGLAAGRDDGGRRHAARLGDAAGLQRARAGHARSEPGGPAGTGRVGDPARQRRQGRGTAAPAHRRARVRSAARATPSTATPARAGARPGRRASGGRSTSAPAARSPRSRSSGRTRTRRRSAC